jgi:formylglycine-generating enzyme required for sulfatase activity
VAVFEVEAKRVGLPADALEGMADYLGTLMARRGYQVVPRSQLKERLSAQKKDSYKQCFDESCQIEIGKELAADKSLATQILKLGGECKVNLGLFDLKKAASERAGTASGKCDEANVVKSLEAAVLDMFGEANASSGVDLPGPDGPVAPATDDKKAYRKELEKAWVALAGAVRKLGPQEQLERYQAFLADYPVDNPYTAKVQKAVEGLEARLDKEAEAKRKADEKAAALEAERQRAAELKKVYDDLKAMAGPAAEQLEAWKKFLADYPDRNPYLSTAKRKMADLEAQAKKEAAEAVRRAPPPGTVRIPGGEFLMGCSPGDGKCGDSEKPAHKVWVSEFFLDATEVAVEEYAKCVQAGKCSEPKSGGKCTWAAAGLEQHPLNCVDWSQAEAYCKWDGKRLPTEAEWEKAARGGVAGSRYGDSAEIAWTRENSGGITHPVGEKQGNAFGLFDMLGNAMEWCADWKGDEYYKYSPTRNPVGPGQGQGRVLRGLSFNDTEDNVRVSLRTGMDPKAKFPLIGFRCARSASPGP